MSKNYFEAMARTPCKICDSSFEEYVKVEWIILREKHFKVREERKIKTGHYWRDEKWVKILNGFYARIAKHLTENGMPTLKGTVWHHCWYHLEAGNGTKCVDQAIEWFEKSVHPNKTQILRLLQQVKENIEPQKSLREIFEFEEDA